MKQEWKNIPYRNARAFRNFLFRQGYKIEMFGQPDGSATVIIHYPQNTQSLYDRLGDKKDK